MASHERSVGKRVRSVIITLGEIVAGFLVLVLAMIGLSLLMEPSRPVHYLVGSVALIISTGIMFATAERWGGFILGFIFAPALFKGVGYTISPPNGLSRAQAVLLLAYCITALTTLWRFIPPRRRRATPLDRATLTAF